jgi:hypothetical protein
MKKRKEPLKVFRPVTGNESSSKFKERKQILNGMDEGST